MHRLYTLLAVIVLFVGKGVAAPNINKFEGTINLVKHTVFDTSYISVSVKGDMIRLEQRDKNKRITTTYIIDVNKEIVLALSPQRKMFTQVRVGNTHAATGGNIEVIKTENSMAINGVTCYQWRVKDRARNTEVAYWVANKNYAFFEKLVRLLARTEDSFNLFALIPNNTGFFPLLTVERTHLRKEKLRVSVTGIKSAKLNDNLFRVPYGYEEVKRTS
ncbi:MAG: DUF4412 domain-containing protein [Bacteroidales bacterium]|nr:DUF4412 domain-containing protein [Bacteroidales bacterium]MBN2748042.1 DUF4412 domain-containing protein [Bacteroidales bacterium]